MKLYTVQYETKQELVVTPVTVWCASIADATKSYNDAVNHSPAIKIVTLPSGREEMAAFLNERGVKV